MKYVLFDAGQTVFSQGDDSTHTYQIEAGSVDIVITGKDGAERQVATLGPGEVFGEMGIIDPAPRSATAIAREETACNIFAADEVVEMMSNDPAQAMALIRSLIIRLRNSNRKLVAKAPPGPPKRPVV